MQSLYSGLFRNHATRKPALYTVMVILFSWFFWLTAVVSFHAYESFSGKLLVFIGLLGPTVISLYLLRNHPYTDTKRFLARAYDYTRIDAKGYVQILGIPVLLSLVSIVLSLAIGQPARQFFPNPTISYSVLSFMIFLVSTLLVGPITEEIGWRGFLLDRLLKEHAALMSSIIVAIIWAVWYLPLVFMSDHPLDRGTSNSMVTIFFFASLFPKSILFTYFFQTYNRSTLSAILFHFSINAAESFFTVTAPTVFLQLVLWVCLAAYIIRTRQWE